MKLYRVDFEDDGEIDCSRQEDVYDINTDGYPYLNFIVSNDPSTFSVWVKIEGGPPEAIKAAMDFRERIDNVLKLER